ncbi:MAG: hypothetical protein ACPG36_06300, partial [Candidatus Puniceispirillaceae bacterium]
TVLGAVFGKTLLSGTAAMILGGVAGSITGGGDNTGSRTGFSGGGASSGNIFGGAIAGLAISRFPASPDSSNHCGGFS